MSEGRRHQIGSPLTSGVRRAGGLGVTERDGACPAELVASVAAQLTSVPTRMRLPDRNAMWITPYDSQPSKPDMRSGPA